MRPEAPPSELAVAVARHFEGMEVDEEECIGGFLERLENPSGPTEYARKSCYFDGRAPHPSVRKRKRTKLAARPGEQVRTKVHPLARQYHRLTSVTMLVPAGCCESDKVLVPFYLLGS